MLKSLTLHRFRHVEPGTVLRFTEGFNVLLGRNGTGKTTLLDLISMVLRSDFSALKEEEFDIEYELIGVMGSVVVRFVNSLDHVAAEIAAAAPTHPRRRGRRRDISRPRIHAVVRGDRIEALESLHFDGAPDVDVFQESVLDLVADRGTAAASEILGELARDGGEAFRFDEGLQTYYAIINEGNLKKTEGGQGSFILEFDRETKKPVGGFPYMPECPTTPFSRVVVMVPPHSSIARFAALVGVVDVAMSYSVGNAEPGLDDELLWEFTGTEFRFALKGGAVFNHEGLSFGQKRLLAFLYYLDANPRYVVADELVNGMHHDWIRACLDEISDRQSFLTSQNPLLLDYLPLESVEQVERTFIQCRTEVVDDTARRRWSNLTRSDAEELFADYKVGIQPLGEILRARGLW